jgi:RNA polymerase sigma-70 factor
MPAFDIDDRLAERLHQRSGAEQWGVSLEAFKTALEASAHRALGAPPPGAAEVRQYLEGLHLKDLALATACRTGHEGAWEHFVREYRPVLYRSAHAIDPTGGARDLADSLHAELFGLEEREGRRQSLFQYFHGRSSLATWLRAVLAQRHVDRLRAARRYDQLPDEDAAALAAAPSDPDPERGRLLQLIRLTLEAALRALEPRDRLRLMCYYAQQMTLAEIGRLMHEHEATVSRNLARVRQAVRTSMEEQLRVEAHLEHDEIRRAFEGAIEDAGPLDLGELLGGDVPRKKGDGGRSKR